MEDLLYLQKQKGQLAEYEGRCVRCGECCGAKSDDPCAQLAKDAGGDHYCMVYPDRLGPQKTVSGKAFNCVLIREGVRFNVPYSRCSYLRGK